MQIVNKLLFLAIAAGGGFYWWQQEQTRAEYERQVGAMSTTLDHRLANPLAASDQGEALFMRSLIILADFRNLKNNGKLEADESIFLSDALTAAGYTSSQEIGVISRNLRDNLNVCMQLQIFGDGSGSQAMLTGQAPIIHAGPFKNEPLVIMRRLSPQLAPEIVNHPANFSLVPAPVADMIWPYTVDDTLLGTANNLKLANLLDTSSFEAIKARNEAMKQ